ncbi:hypothetical protein ACOMHN_023054 [Nucella lapillus]
MTAQTEQYKWAGEEDGWLSASAHYHHRHLWRNPRQSRTNKMDRALLSFPPSPGRGFYGAAMMAPRSAITDHQMTVNGRPPETARIDRPMAPPKSTLSHPVSRRSSGSS